MTRLIQRGKDGGSGLSKLPPTESGDAKKSEEKGGHAVPLLDLSALGQKTAKDDETSSRSGRSESSEQGDIFSARSKSPQSSTPPATPRLPVPSGSALSALSSSSVDTDRSSPLQRRLAAVLQAVQDLEELSKKLEKVFTLRDGTEIKRTEVRGQFSQVLFEVSFPGERDTWMIKTMINGDPKQIKNKKAHRQEFKKLLGLRGAEKLTENFASPDTLEVKYSLVYNSMACWAEKKLLPVKLNELTPEYLGEEVYETLLKQCSIDKTAAEHDQQQKIANYFADQIDNLLDFIKHSIENGEIEGWVVPDIKPENWAFVVEDGKIKLLLMDYNEGRDLALINESLLNGYHLWRIKIAPNPPVQANQGDDEDRPRERNSLSAKAYVLTSSQEVASLSKLLKEITPKEEGLQEESPE